MVEEVINPDMKKEVVGGLKNTLITLAAVIIEIAGLFLISGIIEGTLWKVVGNLVWLAGTALMVWIIVRNFKAQHGGGFKIANAVIKIIIQFIFTLFFILMNFAM